MKGSQREYLKLPGDRQGKPRRRHRQADSRDPDPELRHAHVGVPRCRAISSDGVRMRTLGVRIRTSRTALSRVARCRSSGVAGRGPGAARDATTPDGRLRRCSPARLKPRSSGLSRSVLPWWREDTALADPPSGEDHERLGIVVRPESASFEPEREAKSALYVLTDYLNSTHRLTLQSSKTAILATAEFIGERARSPVTARW